MILGRCSWPAACTAFTRYSVYQLFLTLGRMGWGGVGSGRERAAFTAFLSPFFSRRAKPMPPSRRTTGGPSSASSEAPEAGWLKGRSLFYQLEGDRFPTCWRVSTHGPKAVRLSRDDGITIQLPTKDIQQLAAGQNIFPAAAGEAEVPARNQAKRSASVLLAPESPAPEPSSTEIQLKVGDKIFHSSDLMLDGIGSGASTATVLTIRATRKNGTEIYVSQNAEARGRSFLHHP